MMKGKKALKAHYACDDMYVSIEKASSTLGDELKKYTSQFRSKKLKGGREFKKALFESNDDEDVYGIYDYDDYEDEYA